jgi:catechol 2,3-dioxygenase-like lactoylglutathione lyase family enzyme
MLSASNLVAFVATTKPESARAFYEGTLGLRLISDDPFAIVFDVNGTTLRVTKLREYAPAPFTVLGWHVSDIRETLRWLSGRGVEPMRVPGLPQDEIGVWTAPGGAQIAWFKDPDGNTLSLTQT